MKCIKYVRKGDKMISEELLSNVLNEGNITSIGNSTYAGSKLNYTIDNSIYRTINIYELAYKCKVWAYENGFLIGSNCRKGITITDVNTHTMLNNFDVDFDDFIEFEVKACQWILKERK